MITAIFLVSLFTLGVQSQLPTDTVVTTYRGEGVNCDATDASVMNDPSIVVESEEGVVIAVAQAVAQAVDTIAANPTTAVVVAQANAAAELVLEVVARAVATVTAEINSPNPGCWAISFERAEAVAVAKATVTAIAEAFAEAQTQGLIAQVDGQVQNAETDVQVAVEEIALLLADGSGSGRQSAKASVETEARATAVNCAIAQAFAAVAEGVAQTEVLAQVGCPTTASVAGLSFEDQDVESLSGGCDCIHMNNQGAPNKCAQWQKYIKIDYICYVKDPSSCPCAVSSSVYSGMSWRYCGPTMKEMQDILSITDEKNKIFSKPSGFGYCANLNGQNDEISTAPAPPPPPSFSTCPPFQCIGDAEVCCSQSGGQCTTRLNRTFGYLGKCSTGFDFKDKWSNFYDKQSGNIDCYCP